MNTGIYSFSTGVADFPDKWAMTIYFSGCNMNCDFCYNKHVVDGPPNYTVEEIWEEFLSFKQITPDIGIVLSGGEPTVNSDARKIYRNCVQYKVPVAIHTNGTFFTLWGRELESVIVSMKPDSHEHYYKLLRTGIEEYGHVSKKQLRYVINVNGEEAYGPLLEKLSPYLHGWDIVSIENVLK